MVGAVEPPIRALGVSEGSFSGCVSSGVVLMDRHLLGHCFLMSPNLNCFISAKNRGHQSGPKGPFASICIELLHRASSWDLSSANGLCLVPEQWDKCIHIYLTQRFLWFYWHFWRLTYQIGLHLGHLYYKNGIIVLLLHLIWYLVHKLHLFFLPPASPFLPQSWNAIPHN